MSALTLQATFAIQPPYLVCSTEAEYNASQDLLHLRFGSSGNLAERAWFGISPDAVADRWGGSQCLSQCEPDPSPSSA